MLRPRPASNSRPRRPSPNRRFEYDVALSFASGDRAYVEQVASALRAAGVRVFYDAFEEIAMWGADLYVHLDEVFRTRSRLVVMFVSRQYAERAWTNHERRSAQARALVEMGPYILPARLDDTDVPGLLPTTAYVDCRGGRGADELAGMIQRKLVDLGIR